MNNQQIKTAHIRDFSNVRQQGLRAIATYAGEQCSPLRRYAGQRHSRLDVSTSRPNGRCAQHKSRQGQAATRRPAAGLDVTYVAAVRKLTAAMTPMRGSSFPTSQISQVGVGAGIARPVAPQGATYYGVPPGTQGLWGKAASALSQNTILVNQKQSGILSCYIHQPLCKPALAKHSVEHLAAWKRLCDLI